MDQSVPQNFQEVIALTAIFWIINDLFRYEV